MDSVQYIRYEIFEPQPYNLCSKVSCPAGIVLLKLMDQNYSFYIGIGDTTPPFIQFPFEIRERWAIYVFEIFSKSKNRFCPDIQVASSQHVNFHHNVATMSAVVHLFNKFQKKVSRNKYYSIKGIDPKSSYYNQDNTLILQKHNVASAY